MKKGVAFPKKSVAFLKKETVFVGILLLSDAI